MGELADFYIPYSFIQRGGGEGGGEGGSSWHSSHWSFSKQRFWIEGRGKLKVSFSNLIQNHTEPSAVLFTFQKSAHSPQTTVLSSPPPPLENMKIPFRHKQDECNTVYIHWYSLQPLSCYISCIRSLWIWNSNDFIITFPEPTFSPSKLKRPYLHLNVAPLSPPNCSPFLKV